MDEEQFYSPSSAYAEADRRGPDHDAMQIAFYRWRLKARRRHQAEEWEDKKYTVHSIEPEMPILGKYGIRGFADVAEGWQQIGAPEGVELLVVYEIKPKIFSCGALIRQLKVLKNIVSNYAVAQINFKLAVITAAVLRADDPKLPDFRELWSGPIFLWDGQEGFTEAESP